MNADVKLPSARSRPVVLIKIYGDRLDTLNDTLSKLASSTVALAELNVALRDCSASYPECRELLIGCFVALSEQAPALTPQLVLEQHSSQTEVSDDRMRASIFRLSICPVGSSLLIRSSDVELIKFYFYAHLRLSSLILTDPCCLPDCVTRD